VRPTGGELLQETRNRAFAAVEQSKCAVEWDRARARTPIPGSARRDGCIGKRPSAL